MQKLSETALLKTPNSPWLTKIGKQIGYVTVCLKMCLQLCFLVTIISAFSSVAIGNNAHASGIFSWLSANKTLPAAKYVATDSSDPTQTQIAKQTAAFGELAYHYFQEDYQQVLQLIAVGREQHGFTHLSTDNTDRLNLMQGAAQLQLGMYNAAQAKFESLLSETSSPYVQANTWFFMAKAGFDNKQSFLSERAYTAIIQHDLAKVLSISQWYELVYLTAFTRQQLNQDWLSLAAQIPNDNIYTAYLLANQATILFNSANYAQSSQVFTQAKQALIANQNKQSGRGFASKLFDSVSNYVRPWSWFTSEQAHISQQREALSAPQTPLLEEQNALFDRINLGLGQSLLQQGDLPNAIAVIQNVGEGGAQSQQALLNYGWANAHENRLQTAMAAWQYLQQNSVGLTSLQASYGIAYALSQQDNLGQAFFALKDTASQIDTTLVALSDFALSVQQDAFFANYQQLWPQALSDIQIGFFAPSANFDAGYLLNMRTQAKQIQADIAFKAERINQLTTLLQERELVYQQRLQSLSVNNAQQTLNQAQQYINSLASELEQSNTFEEELALAERMSNSSTKQHIQRVNKAQARINRLAADKSAKRPLKASYQERLRFVEGILKWQLSDNFIAQQWQHQQQLSEAQSALDSAQAQYQQLKNIAQSDTMFSKKREDFSAIKQALEQQSLAAQTVYQSATSALGNELLRLIEVRRQQLQIQSVNTRLAMLRIQDISQPQERR